MSPLFQEDSLIQRRRDVDAAYFDPCVPILLSNLSVKENVGIKVQSENSSQQQRNRWQDTTRCFAIRLRAAKAYSVRKNDINPASSRHRFAGLVEGTSQVASAYFQINLGVDVRCV
jgi:hypothetical protein